MNIVEMRAIVQTCSFPNLMLAVFRDIDGQLAHQM